MTEATFPLSNSEKGLPSAVRWSHLMLKGRIQPGDTVIDATAGNGHDTLFLAQEVGPTGLVYAFDVQSDALESTRRRMESAWIENHRFILLHRGHEVLAQALPAEAREHIRAIMFNLGYLPGSDHTLITSTHNTIQAIQSGLDWLMFGGVMTVVVYPGHLGGAEEGRAVAMLADELAKSGFEVQHLRPVNPRANPPELWVFFKRPVAKKSAIGAR